jgi:hypothetical protein
MAHPPLAPAWPSPLSPRIKALDECLIPQQQPTSRKLTRSADYYEQRCVKYAHRASFHCYAEFLHALLMEAEQNVIAFVPQPFRLQIGRSLYTPDVHVTYRTGAVVRELKPEGRTLAEGWQQVLVEFFHHHQMKFELISNEWVLEQEALALHWLPVIQILAEAQREGVDTGHEESQMLYALMESRCLVVGDLLTGVSRLTRYRNELALLRLLHQHRILADLSQHPWDYDTEIRL